MKFERLEYCLKANDGSDLHWGEIEASRKLAVAFRDPDANNRTAYLPAQVAQGDSHSKATPMLDMPTHVLVNVIQYSPNGTQRWLEVEKLEHVRSFNGGIRYRDGVIPGPGRGVDCKSHTYSMYLYNGYVHPEIVIAVAHGGGPNMYLFPDCFADQTLPALAKIMTDGQFYDVCGMIIESFEHGKEHGTSATTRKLHRAFFEGRLKKKRKNNRIHVEELPIIGGDGFAYHTEYKTQADLDSVLSKLKAEGMMDEKGKFLDASGLPIPHKHTIDGLCLNVPAWHGYGDKAQRISDIVKEKSVFTRLNGKGYDYAETFDR